LGQKSIETRGTFAFFHSAMLVQVTRMLAELSAASQPSVHTGTCTITRGQHVHSHNRVHTEKLQAALTTSSSELLHTRYVMEMPLKRWRVIQSVS
jgi:hypothetical protein